MDQSFDDLIELARICMRQSTLAGSKRVAAELRRMAKEYQRRAADLVQGDDASVSADPPSAARSRRIQNRAPDAQEIHRCTLPAGERGSRETR
jgi:hypothetical protein